MQPMPLRIGVLGPLTAARGEESVTPGSPMLRCLLALLALHPHRVVSRDEIVDTLWGESPPKSCLASVHVYIGRLRTLLEPERERRSAGLLVASANGYLLAPEPSQLDLLEFRELTAGGALADALGLWRGPVLAGLGARLAGHPSAVELNGARIATALAYAEQALPQGGAPDAVGVLRALAHDEPLHEALHAQLILALAASGQQASALGLFAEVRDRLADELGVDPGRELADAHLRVLRHDLPTGRAAAAPAPRQLPADVRAFTGRTDLLDALDAALLTEDGDTVVTVTGTAGVGKSALAVHWAQRAREQFPDGQLFLNLRGHSPTPALRPIDALAQLLRALGVAAEQVPVDVDEAAALYRSILTDRRVLVLLDNAQSPDQVRPLLPGGPGCRTVVTSRDQLLGLAALDGARPLSVDVLSPDEAHALLVRTVGAARVAAEPDAAADLAAACAHLPLALRIAAANLAGQPGLSIAAYVARLRGDSPLAALAVAGDDQAAVRAAFGLSYHALRPPAQRLFRLLGLAPGIDVSVAAAAVLADAPHDEVVGLLDTLAGAHLVTQHTPGRYTLHDLLRLYAAERARAEERAPEQPLGRLYDWYGEQVDRAASVLYPERVRLPGQRTRTSEPWQSADAVNWLDAERANLLAAVVHAGDHGQRARAPGLADSLRGYFASSASAVDWITLGRAALTAAEQESDGLGGTAAHLSLAEVFWRACDADRSVEHYRQAVAGSRAADWLVGEAAALGNLGSVCRLSGRLDDALGYYTESLALSRRSGRTAGEANALGGLAITQRERGQFAEAAENLVRARELFRQIGSTGGEGVALENLGITYQLLGRYDEARDCLELALVAYRRLGSRANEAMAERELATLHCATGNLDSARQLAQKTLEAARNTADRRLEMESLLTLGMVYQRIGDPASTEQCYEAALRIARQARTRYAEATILVHLAEAANDRADVDSDATHRAAEYATAATALAESCGYGWLRERAGAVLGASVASASDR